MNRPPRPSSSRRLRWTAAVLTLSSTLAAADDEPSFDRPGIAFNAGLVTPGHFTFEQGLPDVESSREAGVRTTTTTADSLLRYGVSKSLELQLANDVYNHVRVHGRGESESDDGAGDTRLGAKVALPSTSKDFEWAALGSVTLATGEAPFTNEHTQVDLGIASTLAIGGVHVGLYGNASRLHGENTWTLSPDVSFDLTDDVGAYLEAGRFFIEGAPDQSVAGGGFTWMVLPSVQLDLSADFGLDADSPDVMAGFGVSIAFR